MALGELVGQEVKTASTEAAAANPMPPQLDEHSATQAVLQNLYKHGNYAMLQSVALSRWQKHQDVQVLPLYILSCARTGDQQAARSFMDIALAHESNYNAAALADLAAGLMHVGDLNVSLRLLDKALAEQPDQYSILTRSGVCHCLRGDFDAAVAVLRRAVQIAPDHLPAVNQLAYALIKQHRLEAAWRLVNDVLTRCQDQAASGNTDHDRHSAWRDACANRMRIWVADERFAEAEQWLQEQQTPVAGSAADETNDKSISDNVINWLLFYADLLAAKNRHQHAMEVLRSFGADYQENKALCLALADLSLQQGHHLSAVRFIRQAIQQDEQNVGLWLRLCNACQTHFPQQARQAAEQALALARKLNDNKLTDAHSQSLSLSEPGPPRNSNQASPLAAAKCAMARVELDDNNLEVAARLFDEVLTEYPQFVPGLLGLGHLKVVQGDIDEAVSLFERVKELAPHQGEAALISARQFPEDEATLEKLERAALASDAGKRGGGGLLFQLAAAWERRKEYTRAFDLLSIANRQSRQLLGYDAQAHRNRCAHIRASFCRSLYEHRRRCGVASTLPVYLVGMPRSGTTLVEQFLSGHSQIFGAGELGVIPQIIQGINRWERHVGSGRSYPECVDDLNAAVVQGVAEKVLRELQAYAPEAKHVVDKLPHNFENIGLIKFLFPNAKIISVRREPRDIAISNYFTDYQAKFGGMGFAYDLEEIGQQLADHNLMMHHWNQVFPGEILEVRYEDLVENPEQGARQMLAYLGLAWEPQVLSFDEVQRAVKTASAWQVRQPLYKSSLARWQHYKSLLADLYKGTNAPIQTDPFEILTLPQPGFLAEGVEYYKAEDLDSAEMSFKKMLHHNPQHAACHYMVGLIYLRKNHIPEGIEEIEQAVDRAPWQRPWREDLLRAYKLAGRDKEADELQSKLQQEAASRSSVVSAENAGHQVAALDDHNFAYPTNRATSQTNPFAT